MSAREPIPDAMLERMLVRRARRGYPGDLRQTVLAGIDAIEPRRGPWPFGWHLPTIRVSVRPLSPAMAGVLLLLALLAGALAVGSAWLRLHQSPPIKLTPIELAPTGIETITPGDVAYAQVVRDGAGEMWAFRSGEVTRFDPASGAHRTWTVNDDAALAGLTATPARAGGIWIWSGDRLLRFTGDGFVETIPAPGPSGLLDEAPDGTLWAAPDEHALVRWDGARWVSPPPGGIPATHVLTAILARAADDVWIASHDPAISGTPAVIAHLEGGRWSVYDWIGNPTRSPYVLVEAADGSIWATRDPVGGPIGMAGLRRGEWTTVDAPAAGRMVDVMSAAADGSIWTILFSDDGSSQVGRFADDRWTTYGPAEGLAGAVGNVSATSGGVFAGTDNGLFRLDGDAWTVLWPASEPSPLESGPWSTFVGVSAAEVWTADMEGVWHYKAGAWDGPINPPEQHGGQVTGIRLGDDGSMWVATVDGVAVLTGDGWATVWDRKVLSIDLAPDGSAWVGDFDQIVHLVPTATGVDAQPVACPMPAIRLAVAADETVWVGGLGYSGKAGLAHYDGTTCEIIDLRTDPSQGTVVEVGSIVADPAGGVVIQAVEGLTDSTGVFVGRTTQSIIRLVDGARTVLASRDDNLGEGAITIGPDGDLWWAHGPGAIDPRDASLERYDGERWIEVLAGVDAWGPISVTPDGSVWFHGPSGIERIDVPVAPSP